MNYHLPEMKNGTITTKVVCALVFLTFTFLWLYMFQSDTLAVAQHRLSHGVTHYNRTVGAVLITLFLFLVQQGVFAVTRLSRRTHALTYLPSFMLLAFLSSFTPNSAHPSALPSHPSFWLWLAPTVLVIWIVSVWLSRQILPFEKDEGQQTGLFSRRMWINLCIMAAMMVVVASLSNTNAVYHFKAHAETSLMRGDADEALRVGEESLETDRDLTMLRAFALSLRGEMGERLFHYPIAGTGADLLPRRSRLLILPTDSVKRHLSMKTIADYELCSLLIDRDLDGFAQQLPKSYSLDNLPKHYKEALVMYQHTHANPKLVYSDPVTEQEWENYQQMKQQYTNPKERRLNLLKNHKDTYWYYYDGN